MAPSPKVVYLLLLLLILLLAIGLWIYRSESALVLLDIASGGAESRFKRQVPAPLRDTVSYRYQGESLDADLYRPRRARAGILLVPGAAAQGKDDPRLVAFASTLARADFMVFVPTLPDIQAMRLHAENADNIGAAFAAFQQQVSGLGPMPMGLGAFSYAAGPTLLAALQPTLQGRVDFIVAIGGYYDIQAVLTYITTGVYQTDGTSARRTPRPYGRLLFAQSQLDAIDARDRAVLQEYGEQLFSSEALPGRAQVEARLGSEGRALLAFIDNTDPQQVQPLYARLPPALQANLRGLDVAKYDLKALRAHLLLIHGRDDDMIPYSQSLALAAAVPDAEAYIVSGLMHVDVRPGLRDAYGMWRAIRALLKLRGPA